MIDTLLCQRTRNACGNRSLLHKDSRPEPILCSFVSAAVIKSQLSNMEVGRIGRSGSADSLYDLCERIGPVGGPQADRLRVEINVVGEVVPMAGLQLS